jgi:DNA-directed RNA polymerase subunit M/transcription elongation factor TFIIS
MPIEFSCNNCNKMLRVPDGTEGKASQCPACGSVSTIPTRSNLSSIVATSSKVDTPKDKPLDDGLVRVTCPKCQYPLRCQPELMGTKGQCKQCKHIFVIGETSVAAVELTSLVFSCPKCDQLFDGKPEMEGRKGKCHSCGEVFAIKLRQAETESKPIVEKRVQTSAPTPTAAPTTPPANLQIVCGSCKGVMEVSASAAGKNVACPHCQQLLQIPSSSNSTKQPGQSVFDQPESEVFKGIENYASGAAKPTRQENAPFSFGYPSNNSAANNSASTPSYEQPTNYYPPAPYIPIPMQPTPYVDPYAPTAQQSPYPAAPYPPSSYPLAPYGGAAYAPPATTPGSNSAYHSYLENAENEIRQERAQIKGQAAGSLGVARGILIFIGILQILFYTVLLLNSHNEVDKVLSEGGAEVSREWLIMFCYLVYGAYVGIGITFIVLAILIYRFPLFCTVSSLILYILGNLVVLVFDPVFILRGIIFKILVISALVKAINDGAHYHR